MKKIKVQNNRLNASFVRNTFNEEDRTIDVVFATGAKVKRFSFFEGEYFEQLSMKRNAVRLDRLNSGAPVLNNHQNRDLNDVIGVVETASVKKGEGVATLRLSNREEVSGLVEDIRDGVIKNISVGYRIHTFKEEKMRKGETVPTLTATDWEPLEVSFVTIPADASAQARNENNQNYNEVIVEEQENVMDKNLEKEVEVRSETSAAEAEVIEEPTTETEVQPTEEVVERKEEVATEARSEEVKTNEVNLEEIRTAEKSRILEIKKAVRSAGLEEDFAEKMIQDDTPVEQARKLILEGLEERSEKAKTLTLNHKLEVGDVDNVKLRNEARVRSLLHRFDPTKNELKEGDREYAGHSLIDMAREFLTTEKNERNVLSLSKTEVAKRALHHSSDFPELLANTANKSLRDAYEATPNTYSAFTREISRADFKEGSSIQLSNGGKLEKVNEHGEYKRGSVEESAEKYSIEKFGKIIGRTWELMVNDDLDAFTRIPSRMGVRAREKENELMWDLITSNAGSGQVMAETGLNLFDAGHGNLGTASVIDIASMGEARKSMRLQTDLDGELIGGLSPQYLYVPAALETVADQFVSQVTPNQNGQVNPFAGRVQVIVEPRLDAASATAWYMMANSSTLDMAELARLNGSGPEIFTREGFDVDGMEVKIRYVFGVKVIDYRGFFKNPGL